MPCSLHFLKLTVADRIWIKWTLCPLSYWCLPSLFQVLQTDFQYPNHMWGAISPCSSAWHATMSASQNPTLFLRLSSRSDGSISRPSLSLLCFFSVCACNSTLFLPFYGMSCWGTTLLLQTPPWDQRLCFFCIPVAGPGVLQLFLSARKLWTPKVPCLTVYLQPDPPALSKE